MAVLGSFKNNRKQVHSLGWFVSQKWYHINEIFPIIEMLCSLIYCILQKIKMQQFR